MLEDALYPLVYDLNGGERETASDLFLNEIEATANPSTGLHLTGESVPLSNSTPTRDGYVFLGWNEDVTEPSQDKQSYDSLTSSAAKSVTMPDSTKTVYAMWAKKPVVKFLLPSGEEISYQQTDPGSDAELPPDPSIPGYTFTGWDKASNSVYEDTEVRATFAPNRYTVTYDANGGEGEQVPPQSAAYDEDVTIKGSPYTRRHYDFIGWNTEPDGSGAAYFPGDVARNLTDEPGGNVVLYAQWKFYIEMPETGANGEATLLMAGIIALLAGMCSMGGKYQRETRRIT